MKNFDPYDPRLDELENNLRELFSHYGFKSGHMWFGRNLDLVEEKHKNNPELNEDFMFHIEGYIGRGMTKIDLEVHVTVKFFDGLPLKCKCAEIKILNMS